MKPAILRSIMIFIVGLVLVTGGRAAEPEYLIGTYYFPGWTDRAKGLEHPLPWQPIKQYPEKKPSLGWYSDSDPMVLRQQTTWMKQYGIGFVVFDWYWDGSNTYLDQAVRAFKKMKIPGEMKFAIMWANHYKFRGGMLEYRLMVNYWISQYLADSDYLSIDGKPVVFIFGVDMFDAAAKKIGVETSVLVTVAEEAAIAAGLPGIHFVGGSPALAHWVNGVAKNADFSSISAYNYRIGYSGSAESASSVNEGYLQLDAAYRQNWNWMMTKSALPYIIPMTSGWDKRPWGGSKNPRHDMSISTPAEFEEHLLQAKRLMDLYPEKSRRMGVICCWNEFGEGSYIEPTIQGGFGHLQKIKKVFGASQ